MSAELPVRILVPHSGAEGLRYACRSLVSGFAKARELAWQMFIRDMQADYRQSLLGYLWIVFPPLANTLIWVMLNNGDVVRIDSGGIPYPLFVLCGTILWGAFNSAIMASIGALNRSRSILSKVNFPHESLVYTALLKSLVDALIPLVLLVPFLFTQPVPLTGNMLLFPVALVGSLLVGHAIGLILAPLASLYTDIGRGIQLILRFGFFVTPVIFPLPQSGLVRELMMLNPLSIIIVNGRTWLAGSGESMPVAFWAIFGVAVLACVVGLILFKVILPHLIERLSS